MTSHAHEALPDTAHRMPTRKTTFALLAAVLAAGLIAGAAWAAWPRDPAPPASDNGNAVVTGSGPGISVPDALASTLEGPLLINGFLYVAADGTVYFTEALAESYPPSIDLARSLEVRGIDPVQLTGLQQTGGISWSEKSSQLAGTVDGTVLTVSNMTQAQ